MAKSAYQRLKEWRSRQSSGEQLPTCKMCDRPLKGKKSSERGVCSYCYPKTEPGCRERKEIMKRYYARKEEK